MFGLAMRVGNLNGFDDRWRRNVHVRITRQRLFSEISQPPGVIKSGDVSEVFVCEELVDGKPVINLHFDTMTEGSVCFYSSATRLDICVLLEELRAALGHKPVTWETTKLPGQEATVSWNRQPSPKAKKGIISEPATQKWKRVEGSKVYYQLTGGSVIQAVSIPDPPSSKKNTIVRVTHQNALGRVDSDVFVRLGNPKAPLDWDDFNTVSDWQQASLVEDLLGDDRGGWISRGKAKGVGMDWSGTYELQIQFPKGHHLIEMKIISRVPEVC